MDESHVVTRSIEVTWGGEQKLLPVLPMNPADGWRRLFAEKFPEHQPLDPCSNCGGTGKLEGIACQTCVGTGKVEHEMDGATAMAMAGSNLIELMLAYDRSKVLGTREWIEENVTDDEMVDAFVEVFRRSFRLGRLPLELMPAVLKPAPAKSPNGRSPIGSLTPLSSATGSATNS